jgi:hypothetical protein
MMAWREIGYKGLDRSACPFQWKGIMEHVEKRIGAVTMVTPGERKQHDLDSTGLAHLKP